MSTIHSGPLLRVLEAIHKNHILYCILRNGDCLCELSEGREVDLLVEKVQYRQLQRLLGSLGFIRLPALGYSPHRFFVRYDEDTDSWLKLDVVTRLTYRRPFHSMATELAELCLRRRRRCGEAFILTPEDELVTTLVDCVLDKACLSPDRAARLRELSEQIDDNQYVAALLSAYCPPEWTWPRLARRIAAGDWPGLLAEREVIVSRFRRRDRLGRWAGEVRDRILRRISRVMRPRGLTVALLAPDGAGKSTAARELQKSFYFAARCIYMGLYGHRSASNKRLRLPGIGFVRCLVTQWGRYLVARYHQARGRLVIFDRYTYDAWLPADKPLSRLRQCRRWLLGHACPAPDLVVLLDAPGEVLYQRKREHSPGSLERQRQGYLQLRQYLPQMEIVDATRDPGQLRREITSLIWRRMTRRSRHSARHEHRLNAEISVSAAD